MKVGKAASTMTRYNVDCLLVQDRKGDEILGIVTGWDILQRARAGESDTVQDIMSHDLVCGSERWLLERCTEALLNGDVCHLPIIGMGGKVSTVLSVHDVSRALVTKVIDGVKPAEPATAPSPDATM